MNTVSLVPGKSDSELAEELKHRIAKVYEPVLLELDAATSAGFVVHVRTGVNAFGKQVIVELIIARHY